MCWEVLKCANALQCGEETANYDALAGNNLSFVETIGKKSKALYISLL